MTVQEFEKFEKLVTAHDFTYEMSDDHQAYLQGVRSLAKIKEAAKAFSPEEVTRIWNKAVDLQIHPPYNTAYLNRI